MAKNSKKGKKVVEAKAVKVEDTLSKTTLALIASIEASDAPAETKASLIAQLRNPQVAEAARRKVRSALPPSTKCLLVNLAGEVEVSSLDLDKVKTELAGITSLADIDIVSVEAKKTGTGRGGQHAAKRISNMATEAVTVFDAAGKQIFDGILLDFAVKNSTMRKCDNGETLPNLVYATSGKKEGLNPLEAYLRKNKITVCKQGTKTPLPIGLHSTLGKIAKA